MRLGLGLSLSDVAVLEAGVVARSLAATLSRASNFSAASSQTTFVPSNATLQVGTGTFTIATWARMASKTTYRDFAGKRQSNNNGNMEYVSRYNPNSDFVGPPASIADRLEFVVYNGTTYQWVQSSIGSPAINTWYFVVAWYDSVAGSVNIQVNNGAVDSKVVANGSANNTYNLWVGGPNDVVAGRVMDGLIGPVAFFKRVLTAGERTALYNSGVPLAHAQLSAALQSESAATFVSYWNMDEAGLHLDQRSSANHLSGSNFPTATAGTVVRTVTRVDVTVGGSLVLTMSPSAGWSPTYTCSDAAFVQAPAGTFTYTPIFEDGGTVRMPSFTGSGGGSAFVQVTVYTYPNFGAWSNHSSNPIISTYYSGGTGQQDSVWFGGLDDLGNGTVFGLGSINTTTINANDALGGFTGTKASLLVTWTPVAGNPIVPLGTGGAWNTTEHLHPTKLLGPATGGPLNGKYVRFYGSGTVGSPGRWVAGRAIGILSTADKQTFTNYVGNPVLTTGDIPGAWQDATTIHLYATTANGIDLFTVPLSDPTTAPTFLATILPRLGSLVAGTDVYDPEVTLNPSGAVEFAVTTTENTQSIRYGLSADGQTFSWFLQPILTASTTQPSGWAISNVGDAVLFRSENVMGCQYAGQVTAFPNSFAAGLFKAQSSSTGHFVNVATTTYASGNTTYSPSPNSYTAANMTAVPGSGTVSVTVTAYAAGGVTLTPVVCTNGVTVTFTLNAMTATHTYTVAKNGVTISTPTSSGGGVLSFTNSVWGASDTITVVP